MTESVRDRWLSIGMSVLLHGSLIALLAIGVWHFRHPAPPPTSSINATVVDARTLKGVGAASTPAPRPKQTPPPAQSTPPPPPTQPEGPPTPTPDELAMRQQAAQEEAEHLAEAQKQLLARQQAEQAREAAQRKAQQAAAEQAAEAKQAEEAAAAAQAKKLAEAKKLADAKKKAAAAKLAAQKKLAEERKLAEEKKLAQERELAAERQAAAERAARVADLQQSLREDERAAAASGALASWQSEITSRIQNAWIRPPTARPGIKCVLNVGLVPGGSVTGVSIGQCNGDDAVRQSIQTAVYNASPLPPPPNGIPFPRQLIITFQPTN